MLKLLESLPTLSFREKLAYLTWRFLKEEQTECPLEHLFEPGLYIREIKIPAETLFIGRIHRHGHACQLIEGSLIHVTEEGSRRVDAPFTLHSTPGYQMVLYSLTPIVGRSIHLNPSDSRDIQTLEDEAFESVESLKNHGERISERIGLEPSWPVLQLQSA